MSSFRVFTRPIDSRRVSNDSDGFAGNRSPGRGGVGDTFVGKYEPFRLFGSVCIRINYSDDGRERVTSCDGV